MSPESLRDVDADFGLLVTRVLEVHVDRENDFPVGSASIRTTTAVATEARPGRIANRNDVLGLALTLRIEVTFSEDLGEGREGPRYAAIRMTLDGVAEADRAIEGDPSTMRVREPAVQRLSEVMLASAEAHLTAIIAMTRMPVSLASQQLLELARKTEIRQLS